MGLPGGEKTGSGLLSGLHGRNICDSGRNILQKMVPEGPYGSKTGPTGGLMKKGFCSNAKYKIKNN